MIQPPTTGLIIAAPAEPMFMMPLAVPAYCGAMSMGTAHIGPIVISLKKKPTESASAARGIDSEWTSMIGASDSSARNMHVETMTLRARRRLPVRRMMKSEEHTSELQSHSDL